MTANEGFSAEITSAKNKEHALYAGVMLVLTAIGAAVKLTSTKSRKRTVELLDAKRNACALRIHELSHIFSDLFLANYFVLDSNVWMGDNADPLFEELHASATLNNGRICFFESQANEIENLKKRSRGPAGQYNEGSAGRARHAMRRIDEFRRHGLIKHINDRSIAAGKTHVDDIFIDYFALGVEPGATVRFVSNDVGLRVRMMKIEAENPALFKIVDMDMLIAAAAELKAQKAELAGITARLSALKKN